MFINKKKEKKGKKRKKKGKKKEKKRKKIEKIFLSLIINLFFTDFISYYTKF